MEAGQIVNYNIFNEDKVEELMEFLHSCINEICGYTGPTFHKFSNIDWTKEEFNNTHKFMSSFLQKPSCLYVEEEKMPLEYKEFPKHVQQAILTCLRIRKIRLTDALVYKYSCEQAPTLFDFDWRLKYVMGSSKMASIKEPLLQLDLIMKEKEKDEILELELNKDELELLITTIESIDT